MLKQHVAITIFLILILVVSGCVGQSTCKPENSNANATTKAPSVKECIDLCHSYGITWRTQITGQDSDHGLLHCFCYSC